MIGENTRLLLNGICGSEEKADELIEVVDEMINTVAGGSLLNAVILFQMYMIVAIGRSNLNSDAALNLRKEDGSPANVAADFDEVLKALALADRKSKTARNEKPYRAWRRCPA